MANHKLTHIAEGLSRILEQYKGAPKFKVLLTSFLKEVQVCEDALWGVYLGRMLDNAVGEQLDVIGRRVGEERKGRNDTLYRVWLRIRVMINRSFGRARDIQRILLAATALPFRYVEPSSYGPAAFEIWFDDAFVLTDMATPNLYRDAVRQARAAGVNGQLIYPIRSSGTPGSPALKPFKLSHAGGTQDPDYGLAHVGDTGGAPLSHAMR